MMRFKNWLVATKQSFTERWNSWKRKRANRELALRLEEEVFAELIRTKDAFIVYLQDEIAELKALQREVKGERVRMEVPFESTRGYKSVHTRIREQALANRKKHEVVEVEEKQYEKVIVND